MTTNTKPTDTRDLVYLAGLLHDERVVKQVSQYRTMLAEVGITIGDGEVIICADSNEQGEYCKLIDFARRLALQIDQLAEKDTRDKPLASILSSVQITHIVGDNEVLKKAKQVRLFSPQKLTLDDHMLDEPAVSEALERAYSTLWAEFGQEVRKLPTGNFNAFVESLFQLLRQYTWCIPVSENRQDISLFHHLKTTAALAHCLYKATPGEPYRFQEAVFSAGMPLQLACVDLSGIQTFIYNIASKYAARSLRGRSYSLQVLMDGIARKIQAETDTYSAHLVYSSGGKFFMLLPGDVQLESIQYEIEKAVWDKFGGSLYVCFGQVSFRYEPDKSQVVYIDKEDIEQRGELGQLWKAAADKAAEQKQQKNKTLLLNAAQFNELFSATGYGGNRKLCAVTGREGVEGQTLVKPDDERELLVAKEVNEQIKIGEALVKHRYRVMGAGDFRLLDGLDSFSLEKEHYLSNNLPPNIDVLQTLQPGSGSKFLHDSRQNPNVGFGFRFFGGSQVAMADLYRSKSFEELTGIIRQNHKDEDSAIVERYGHYNRLAVLRMDVDGLGKLFINGFDKQNASFSAYSTLSGLLDWFFSGYLNTIREQEEFKNWVNIIYSGGDDVFAVGRWDRIIDFADCIQQTFKSFTGRNDLTISAGIFLMRPRYPIGKAALAAGEAEDNAKDFNKAEKGIKPMVNRVEKDAVCLFDVVVGWDEFAVVRELKTQWVKWLTDGTLSKGLLLSMFDWYETATRRDKKSNQLLNDQSWRWNAAYSLARQRTRNPNDPKNKALDTLKLLLMCGQYTDLRGQPIQVRLEAFIVACRWAELTFRDQLNAE
ncbi:type III-A CRISPR-associated protein Cas10/Csm1 [Rudanella lutea]|uniref:type III-A CRISPR-associated protein Cas10/Csm1 n=1 Tax=Rudanella lutea TaxID=451374 RepID=UPI000370F713|nr:type III-A CRISPR-associated protein Cas10/Csm1 [Rudanella lutea]